MKLLILCSVLLFTLRDIAVADVTTDAIVPFKINSLLSLKVTVDKRDYTSDEPIYLTYTLSNIAPRQHILINGQQFSHPPALLIIKAPDGQLLSSLTRPGHLNLSAPPTTLLLRPASFYGMRLDLREQYPDGPLLNPHNFDVPGTYQILGVYENKQEMEDENKGGARRFWTGRIISEPVIIEIKSLSAEKVEGLKQSLRNGDDKARIQAVDLIRRMRLAELLTDVRALLDTDASVEVRRAAAGTLTEMPDIRLYDAYLKHLKSPDSIVKSEMAHSLRMLKQKGIPPALAQRAALALMEAADPQRYPDSYFSALGALKEFNDPQTIPVLRKIAGSAPSEQARRFAKQILQKLESQAFK